MGGIIFITVILIINILIKRYETETLPIPVPEDKRPTQLKKLIQPQPEEKHIEKEPPQEGPLLN